LSGNSKKRQKNNAEKKTLKDQLPSSCARIKAAIVGDRAGSLASEQVSIGEEETKKIAVRLTQRQEPQKMIMSRSVLFVAVVFVVCGVSQCKICKSIWDGSGLRWAWNHGKNISFQRRKSKSAGGVSLS
jgi:hypothetical protein